jgi:hypothetical protein
MNTKWLLVTISSILLIGLFAWSPWLTKEFVENRAITLFNQAWESVIDGCGTNCNGCGAVSSRRVPFGMFVTIEFACGLIPEDSPAYHQRTSVFVSPFGSVHGFPKP